MTITFPLGSWKMKRSTTSGKYRSPRKSWRNTEQKWKKSIQGLLKRSLKQKPGKNERYEYIDIHITCLCSVEAAHIHFAGHVKRCTFFLRVSLLQGIEIVQIKGYPIVWDGIRCGQLYTPVCEVQVLALIVLRTVLWSWGRQRIFTFSFSLPGSVTEYQLAGYCVASQLASRVGVGISNAVHFFVLRFETEISSFVGSN